MENSDNDYIEDIDANEDDLNNEQEVNKDANQEDVSQEDASQEDASGSGGNSVTPSPGLAQIEGAVIFTNDQVLKPDTTVPLGTADLMVEQAAAMMIQDTQSFIQGNEQLLMMATAKALALLVDPATQQAGTTALGEITTFTATMPAYATLMGTAASGIVTAFES